MRRSLTLLLASIAPLVFPAAPGLAQNVNKSIFEDDGKSEQPEGVATSPASPLGSGPHASSPTTAAQPAGQPAGRVPVPSAAAQQEATRVTNDLFKSEVAAAKTPAEKLALAQRMASIARAEEDPATRYVLLTRAREIATDAGDAAAASQLLDETARRYEIDYAAVKLALFESLAKSVTGPRDCAAFASGMNHWIEGQVWLDHYDVARRAGDLALQVARRAGDASLAADTRRQLKGVEEAATAYAAAQPALAKLRNDPADPAANAAAGRFYCLAKGDWARGLPLLARGADPTLKALAEKELGVGAMRPEAAPEARLALADAWWGYAHQKDLAPSLQPKAAERSAHWYRLALPQLSGLQAKLAEKRIAEATGSPDAKPGVYLSELTETKAERIVHDGLWGIGKDVMNKQNWPLSVNGVRYARGIGFNPATSGGTSRILYTLGGHYRRFAGLVGVNDTGNNFKAVLTFKIVGDGRELWRSQPYKEKKTTEPFSVDVSGVNTLELVVDCDGTGHDAHVVWLDPRLEPK